MKRRRQFRPSLRYGEKFGKINFRPIFGILKRKTWKSRGSMFQAGNIKPEH
jgi:hypothetical protein